MRFINPKTDFAFKRIFGGPNSKPILISLLNALLYDGCNTIADLEILDPYQAPKLKDFKDSYVDVKARLANGKLVIIEMQVLNSEDFRSRVLYNTAKSYGSQLRVGKEYEELLPVVALTITNFVMFKEFESGLSRFRMLECREHTEYASDLEMVFLELPKFQLTLDSLDSLCDKWVFFFKEARRLSEIPPVLADVPPIRSAFEIANEAILSPEELEDQERRELFLWHQRGVRTLALREGYEEGVEQGIEEGIQQGIQQGVQQGVQQGREEGERRKAIAIAERLLSVLDDAAIATTTGLSMAEVQALRSSNPVEG